jgi:hypothetical protein
MNRMVVKSVATPAGVMAVGDAREDRRRFATGPALESTLRR